MTDRAIDDYDTALQLDPTLADVFNARGELWRKSGDRPKALADFGAAIKLNPDHAAARANYKSLAQELERLGALIAVAGKPSFNCKTARRAVEKAICANPRACRSRSRDQCDGCQGHGRCQEFRGRPQAAARAGGVYRPPQCRVRPAGLRSAQGHEASG